ncbi:MAG TPA: hypothetical protein VEF04_05410 [Blastocatellia bacterium]|nr:hypothetical protein [Blastocatellia bacterium]
MLENNAIESLKRSLKEAREAKKQTEAKLAEIRARIADLQEEEAKCVAQLPKLNKVIEQTGAAYRLILQSELFPEDEDVFERGNMPEERPVPPQYQPQQPAPPQVSYPQTSVPPSAMLPSQPPMHQPNYGIPARQSYAASNVHAEVNESAADIAAIEAGTAEQHLNQSDNVRFNDFRIPQAATIVLREAGHPLHVTEIYRRMADGGFEFRGQHQLITLAVSLSRAKRFRKVAPGTFELDPKYLSGQVA